METETLIRVIDNGFRDGGMPPVTIRVADEDFSTLLNSEFESIAEVWGGKIATDWNPKYCTNQADLRYGTERVCMWHGGGPSGNAIGFFKVDAMVFTATGIDATFEVKMSDSMDTPDSFRVAFADTQVLQAGSKSLSLVRGQHLLVTQGHVAWGDLPVMILERNLNRQPTDDDIRESEAAGGQWPPPEHAPPKKKRRTKKVRPGGRECHIVSIRGVC